jgi:hypothetical protein
LVAVGFEFRALYLLGRHSTTLATRSALFYIYFFAVLWFELRAYILSHSTSLFS